MRVSSGRRTPPVAVFSVGRDKWKIVTRVLQALFVGGATEELLPAGGRADHCKASEPGAGGLVAASFIRVAAGPWMEVRSREETQEKRHERSEHHLMLNGEKFTSRR